MGGNPWIRRRGSRLWDPKTGRATLLPSVIDQPNGSVAFLHSSSKSSGTAREWFFVLARPRLRTNYCRAPVTLLAKFSLWTVPGGIRAGLFFIPTPYPFSTFETMAGKFCCARHRQRGTRTTTRKADRMPKSHRTVCPLGRLGTLHRYRCHPT